MKLKDSATIWGIPISVIKEQAKLYKKWVAFMYILDIVILSIVTMLLFNSGLGFSWYIGVIIVFTLLCNLIITQVSNASKYEAFKFFKANRNLNITEKQFSILDEQLYSVLYCLGYHRLKQNKSLADYCESVFSLCCEDKYNAKRVMKYLNKYLAKDDENVTLKCKIVTKGKVEYLVDISFCADGKVGSEDGDNQSGDA